MVCKRGLIARHTEEIELWAIEEANLHQCVLGRVFGFGRVSIQGTGDDALETPVVADPVIFRRAIQGAIGQAKRPIGASSAAGPASAEHRTAG
jgi:uncharacterized membrane protein YdbT with pleckstrin-like domain